METFIHKFAANYALAEKEVLPLLECAEPVHFTKNAPVVRPGTRNGDLYLVKEGVWRGYLDDGDDGRTLWFAVKGEAVFSVWGYTENSPSLIGIEALSESTALRIPHAALDELYASSIKLANLGRRLAEQQLLGLENWLVSGSSPRARERYLTLIRETPELLQYVPLKHLASYLWVTPQSLSRIRASIRR